MDASREDKKEDVFNQFQEVDLSFIPPKVSVTDLKLNKKLLDEDEIKAIQDKLKKENDGRFSKKDMNSKYGIIKLDDELFAVYKGLKWDKHLGKGGQGKVKLVQNLITGTWHALKIREELDVKNSEEVRQALFAEEHKKLVSLGKAKKTMITRKKENKPAKHQIILDYERGADLIDFLNDQDKRLLRVPSIRWIDIALQLLQSVKELHDKGFLHCDIKLDNFMYDPINNKIKLIDYGLAIRKDDDNKAVRDMLVGTHSHNAPELYRSHDKYIHRESTEVYALGCTIRELLGFYIEDVPGNSFNTTVFTRDQSIRDFLELMKNDKPYKRPNLNDAIKFFSGIRQNLIPISYSTVGIVNLAEYRNALNKSHFINALKCVDSVVLVDDALESKEDNDLLKAKISRSLAEEGIAVKDKIIVAPHMNQMIARIPEYLEREEKKGDKEVVNYLYFSSVPEMKNEAELNAKGVRKIAVTHGDIERYKEEIGLSFPVKLAHFNLTNNALQTELDRITKKYNLERKEAIKLDDNSAISIAKRRAIAITETQNKLHEKIKSDPMRFTYDFLYKELDNLQAKMLPTKKISRYFGGVFEKKTSKGKEDIGKIKLEIQNKRKLG